MIYTYYVVTGLECAWIASKALEAPYLILVVLAALNLETAMVYRYTISVGSSGRSLDRGPLVKGEHATI